MEATPDRNESDEKLVQAVIGRLSRNGDVGFQEPDTTDQLRRILRESTAMRAAAEELVQIPDGYTYDLEHLPAHERSRARRALSLEQDLHAALGHPVVIMGWHGTRQSTHGNAWQRLLNNTRWRRWRYRRRLRGTLP